MPRIRSIYPEACRSRKLAALTPAAERCWWRLQTHLDDHGRAEDEPDIFASVLFQVQRDVTPGMVDNWLWEMAEAGLIVRYTVGETHLIEVVRWADFQHPQRPKKSTFPPAQEADTRRVRDASANAPRLFADGGEGMGEETDAETEGESEGEPERPALDPSPVDNPVTGGLVAKAAQLGERFALKPHLSVVEGNPNPAAERAQSVVAAGVAGTNRGGNQ